MKPLHIRPARLEDAPRCAKILHDGWRRAFPGLRRKVDVAVFLAETEGETVLVAARGDRVVGFAALYAPEDFLHHLYVEPRARRKGVGTALLAAASAIAHGPISLKTQTANARAQAFYRKQGFVATETGDDGQGPWVRYRAPD